MPKGIRICCISYLQTLTLIKPGYACTHQPNHCTYTTGCKTKLFNIVPYFTSYKTMDGEEITNSCSCCPLLKLQCLQYKSAISDPRLRRIVTEATSHFFSVINQYYTLNMSKYGCKYKQESIPLRFEQVAVVPDDRLLPNSNLVSPLGTPCPLLAGAVYPNYPCHTCAPSFFLPLSISSSYFLPSTRALSVSYPHFCSMPQ